MEIRNQKIINAIIAKANRDCPGSLAMIGIYGSFCTGDIHDKSDLDLMILINDEKGYCLATTFILEDEEIGHDLYCTTWEALEHDAKFTHPHISKLMDSKIVYCADDAHMTRLEGLRNAAKAVDPQESAQNLQKEAEIAFAKAMLADTLAEARFHAGNMIYNIFGAIALRNGRYFKLGTRRVLDEIEAMEHKPQNFSALVDALVQAETLSDLHTSLTRLVKSLDEIFPKSETPAQVYPGTYEEMFSNWRNKVYLAAKTGNQFLAFDSMCSFDFMLRDLGHNLHVMDRYQPNDLHSCAKAYDEILAEYRKCYDTAGISVQSYANVDTFISEYEKKKA